MKDVAICDKPRGADKQALIRGFPNGETHERKTLVPRCFAARSVPAEVKHLSRRRKRKEQAQTYADETQTNADINCRRRSALSQRQSAFIPLVVANERGLVQIKKSVCR